MEFQRRQHRDRWLFLCPDPVTTENSPWPRCYLALAYLGLTSEGGLPGRLCHKNIPGFPSRIHTRY